MKKIFVFVLLLAGLCSAQMVNPFGKRDIQRWRLAASDTNGNFSTGDNAGSDILGAGNISLGGSAGASAEGNNNVIIGESAGGGHLGDANTFIGACAGYVSHGSDSLFVGTHAGRASDFQYSTCIGYGAGYAKTGSYDLVIDQFLNLAEATNTEKTNSLFYFNAAAKNLFIGRPSGRFYPRGLNVIYGTIITNMTMQTNSLGYVTNFILKGISGAIIQ